MDPYKKLLRLIAENEQDEAKCLEWWRESTTEEKLLVWEAIQKDYDNPVMEILSRFAQLAFSQMAERELREK